MINRMENDVLQSVKSLELNRDFQKFILWLEENRRHLSKIVLEDDMDRPLEKGAYRAFDEILRSIRGSEELLQRLRIKNTGTP